MFIVFQSNLKRVTWSLTGTKQEKDWLEMLLDIEKEQKILSLAA